MSNPDGGTRLYLLSDKAKRGTFNPNYKCFTKITDAAFINQLAGRISITLRNKST
jgi:hypothetical protein